MMELNKCPFCGRQAEFMRYSTGGIGAGCKACDKNPTIDAIPVEWLLEFDKYYGCGRINVNTILTAWQKEQEANNESDKP